MDSYNRGYNSGVVLTGNGIGLAIIGKDSGDSTVFPQGTAQAAGFYTISYNVGGVSGFTSGEKVIAYRGTDQKLSWPWGATGGDIWNGWGIGAGSA